MAKKCVGIGSVEVDVFVRDPGDVNGYVAAGGDIIVRLNSFPARVTLFINEEVANALRDAVGALAGYVSSHGVPHENVELLKIRMDANKELLDRELAEINESRVD